jgi:hypothetical protein
VEILSLTRKVSDGQSVVVTVPAGGVTVNNFYKISGFHGIAFETKAENEEVALDISLCEYETDKFLSTDVVSVGDKVYWDDSAKNFTTVVGSNTLIGKATTAKIATSTVCNIKRTTLDS